MSENLRVGIIMGSDSDLPTMQHAGRALRQMGLEFKTDYEERVISVHRTPKKAQQYAHEAESRGLQYIIAGAGGSGHLPGIVASETIVPVMAVAVTKNPDVMNRALGSMIGMPEGKPLPVFQDKAGAYNAGLFVARLLLSRESELRETYTHYESSLEDGVEKKDALLSEIGSEEYIAKHLK